MAAVDTKLEHVLTVNAEELRLILKALGGRLKPEDVEPAKALCDTITRIKAKSVESHLRANQKLIENLDKAAEPDNER